MKLLLVIWIIVMISFSSRPAIVSAQDSRTFEESFMALRNELRENDSLISHFKLINMSPKFVVRKAAHIVLYTGLSILTVAGWVFIEKRYRTYILTIVLCTLYACMDEFYQTFIPGRTGLVSDVLIDSIGIWLGVSLIVLYVELGCRRKWVNVMRLIEE